ncbi:serine/threonine protein kinase [Paracoccus methylarcula]|uniref:serine/threonine protein kinase n=1 Tax=Paracoccus methylarcula TaxID=72022 RepID=UPI0011CDC658|nr:serine/threonine protein kinase [Paracoccus methylarcula]
MSAYPTMDQYNDAVQHPKVAFSDPVLQVAKIATNGMGLPIALGGGFALTYTATSQGRKYAVRCFHKEAKGLEARYGYVDKGLRAAGETYFVGFEYQPTGVLINGKRFPIVKMDWVEGDTLGSFLEDNYSNRDRIDRLRVQFGDLERFLRSKGLAHGDLQNGNVLVKSDLKLIDYDGIYVPNMPLGQGAELGHKHFQHPMRAASGFGPEMDRFSFIVIDLSLRAISQDPELFSKYSNGENIVFTANDFFDPRRSAAFADLKAIPALARDASNFASICAAPLKGVPTLEEFLAGRSIPAAPFIIRSPAGPEYSKRSTAYIGAYDVVDATSFAAVSKQVGNRIELVGRVKKVLTAKTKYGKPYCFLFFDNSRQSVKLNIWSEGLAKLSQTPSQTWVGAWLSVQGLVDPAYTGKHGTSLSITITANSQVRKITETEARHRLRAPASSRSRGRDNRSILDDISSPSAPRSTLARGTAGISRRPAPNTLVTPMSKNQGLLKKIGSAPSTSPRHQSISTRTPVGSSPPAKGGLPWWVWAIGGILLFLWLSG